MTRTRIPAALRRRVVGESQGRCTYCHTSIAITGAQFVIDHIIPEAAGGRAVWENLCVACHSCNEFKGAQVQAKDPVTRKPARLFQPRRQHWSEHFRWSQDSVEIIGLTPVGRATVVALNLNHPLIVEARRRWAIVGWHPPLEDV